MATDKLHCDLRHQPHIGRKNFEASITVQLPTTSANIETTNPEGRRQSSDNCFRTPATRDQFFITDTPSSNANTLISNNQSDSGPIRNGAPHTPPPNYHEIPGVVPSYQGRTSGPPPSYDDVINLNASPPSYQSLFGQVSEARKTSNGLIDLFRQLFLILIGTLGCTMIIGFLLIIPVTMIVVGFFYLNECRAENIPSFLVIGGIVWIVKNVLNCFNQFKRDSFTSNRPPPRRTPISSSNPNHTSNNNNNSNDNTTVNNNQLSTTVHIVSSQNSNVDRNNNSLPTTSAAAAHINSRSQIVQSANYAGHGPSRASAANTRTSATNSQQRNTSQNTIRRPSLIGITSFKCESMLNYFLIVWFVAGCIVVYRIYEPDYVNPQSSAYCHRTVYLYTFWLMTSAFIVMAIVLSCLCCLMISSLVSCSHNR